MIQLPRPDFITKGIRGRGKLPGILGTWLAFVLMDFWQDENFTGRSTRDSQSKSLADTFDASLTDGIPEILVRKTSGSALVLSVLPAKHMHFRGCTYTSRMESCDIAFSPVALRLSTLLEKHALMEEWVSNVEFYVDILLSFDETAYASLKLEAGKVGLPLLFSELKTPDRIAQWVNLIAKVYADSQTTVTAGSP